MEDHLKKINNEIISVFHHLDLFKNLNEIIIKNQNLEKMDQTLLQWMRESFTADLVISIGRICDTDSRSNSLVQFLQDLKSNEGFLKRERYIRLYNTAEASVLDIANRSFGKLAGEGESTFPLSKIDDDISRITKNNPCKKIIDYRNKYVAHTDKIKDIPLPTYDELFESFEIIKEIVKRYNLLIRAANMIDLTPTIQGNWEEVLTIPWKINGFSLADK